MFTATRAKRKLDSSRKRLRGLTELESRWSLARIGVFTAFFCVTAVLTVEKSPAAGWVAGAGMAVFALCVMIHRRIEARLRQSIVHERLARHESALAALDWTDIAPEPPVPLKDLTFARYFMDLDLVGGGAPGAAQHTLLRLLDQTVSTLGWRKLLGLFDSNGIPDDVIHSRTAQVKALVRTRVFRRRLLRAARLNEDPLLDSGALLELAREPLHDDKAIAWTCLLTALHGFALILLFGTLKWHWPHYYIWAWFVALVLANTSRSHFQDAFGNATTLEKSLGKFTLISRVVENFRAPGLESLLEPFAGGERPSSLVRRLALYVSLLSVRGHLLIHFAFNLLVPWDPLCTLGLERVRRRLEARLPDWLESLASLEAFICLAELAQARPDMRFAELLSDGPVYFEAVNVGHPLIRNGVPNSIRLDGSARLYLITGSNMSGKSTFLRTLGINLLLAKAGGPCLADSFRFQNRDLFTLLRVGDLLESQISSFYAEVRELKVILETARQRPIFYLIDEIFRGTNNRERLAGSRAYLQALSATEATGLVATHDLELTSLAESLGGLRNHHFRETFEGGRMSFTYLLREGPCPSTNALKIMEMEGLPI